MTSHQERVIRPGWEGKTPRSPDEFAQAWKASGTRGRLVDEIDDYLERHPFGGEHYERFLQSHKMNQSELQRSKSPFTLSYLEQMRLNLWRCWVLLKGDPSITLTMLVTNCFEAFIISSIFYNLPLNTGSFFRRCILLFFIVLINAFGSILEIMTLYAKRKIVEKHARYALYHPSAEALAAIVMDLPYKLVNTILLNTILYFMGHLRREPGAFFFFLLMSFTMTLTMSMMFRLIGSVTKSVSQALAPASIILLGIALYTGFAIPPHEMKPWIGWIRWLNPVYYGLESLFLNEFIGRNFPCSTYIPKGTGYEAVGAKERVCNTVGSVAGQDFVSGTEYLRISYGFVDSHRWRNFGVLIAFIVLFTGLHLLATEYIASERSKGEVLVFTRSGLKRPQQKNDAEAVGDNRPTQAMSDDSGGATDMNAQASVFHWKDVCYDVKIKTETRRILDHVDGWVKPGTLTALMVSKTG